MTQETPNEPPGPAEWHYLKDGETCGPVTAAQLKRLIQSGQLGADPMVWRQGMRDWIQVSQLGAARPKSAVHPPPAASAAAVGGRQQAAAREGAVQERTAASPAGNVRVANRIVWLCIAGLGLFMIGVWIGSVLGPEEVSRTTSPNAVGRQRVAEPAGTSVGKALPNVGKERDGTSGPPLPPPRPAEKPTGPAESVPAKVADVPGPSGTDAAEKYAEDPLAKNDRDGPTTLFQEINIHRRPSYGVAGLKIAQEVRYQILSRLELGQRLSDGTRKVVQRVEDARLESADDMSRATYESALRDLPGQQYVFTLNELDEIIDFSGFKPSTTTAPVTRPGAEGLMMVTVIDKDGWRELVQLSFLRPDKRIAPGQPWTRQMTHSFEPLGSLKGVTTFTQRGPEGPNMRYDYTHNMTYIPPEKLEGALPFSVSSIEFRVEEAFGSFVFDPAHGHVTEVSETFYVKGTVGTAGSDLLGDAAGAELLAGMTGIQIEERQEFVIRLSRQGGEAVKR